MAYSAGMFSPWRTSQSSSSSGSVPPPNLVSFSTPITSTMSYWPERMASTPWRRAEELDEHAFSTLVIGTPVRPMRPSTRWPAIMPPSAVPQ